MTCIKFDVTYIKIGLTGDFVQIIINLHLTISDDCECGVSNEIWTQERTEDEAVITNRIVADGGDIAITEGEIAGRNGGEVVTNRIIGGKVVLPFAF
jgi:hypothetical protein